MAEYHFITLECVVDGQTVGCVLTEVLAWGHSEEQRARVKPLDTLTICCYCSLAAKTHRYLLPVQLSPNSKDVDGAVKKTWFPLRFGGVRLVRSLCGSSEKWRPWRSLFTLHRVFAGFRLHKAATDLLSFTLGAEIINGVKQEMCFATSRSFLLQSIYSYYV